MTTLPKPLVDGWKAFSDKVCNELTEYTTTFLHEYNNADLIIATGSTGAGKTAMIEACTGLKLGSTSSQESGTKHTYLIPGVIEGKRYLFLDVPGFDAEDLDDWQSFRKLMTAIATINPFVTFRGVLFVDRLGEDRVKISTYKILTWLKHFCGAKYMPNVTIITTFWDTLNNDGIKEKLARYESWSAGELLQPLLHHGAKTYHHGLIVDGDELKTFHHRREQADRAKSARQMIHRRYSEPTDLFLQIYTEIGQGCSLEETTAGHWLKFGSAARSTLEDDEGIRVKDMPGTSHKAKPASSSSSEQKAHAQSSWSWPQFNAEDAMPWIKLLWTAARFYRDVASSFYESGFRYDQYMGEEQGFMDEERNSITVTETLSVHDTVTQEPSSPTWSCAVM